MTDSPSHRDDEIVSAYLDGEASAEEARRVQGDPALLARLEELRDVAALTAELPPLPGDDVRTELIAGALRSAALGEVAWTGEVARLDAKREENRRGPGRALLAVAAVAAAVAGLATVQLLDRSSEQKFQTLGAEIEATGLDHSVPDPADAAEEARGLGAPSTTAAPGARPSATAPEAGDELAETEYLGAFGTRDEAQQAVTERIDTLLSSGGDQAPAEADGQAFGRLPLVDRASGEPCLQQVRSSDTEVASLLWSAIFELSGEGHQVLLFTLPAGGAANGSYRLWEVLLDGCALVRAQTFG